MVDAAAVVDLQHGVTHAQVEIHSPIADRGGQLDVSSKLISQPPLNSHTVTTENIYFLPLPFIPRPPANAFACSRVRIASTSGSFAIGSATGRRLSAAW